MNRMYFLEKGNVMDVNETKETVVKEVTADKTAHAEANSTIPFLASRKERIKKVVGWSLVGVGVFVLWCCTLAVVGGYAAEANRIKA